MNARSWSARQGRRVRAAAGAVAVLAGGLGSATLAVPLPSAAAAAAPQVISWGLTLGGELGVPTAQPRAALDPAVVAGLPATPVQLASGGASYAVLPNGTVDAWGDNSLGELGDPSFTAASTVTPRPVPGLSSIRQVVAGPGPLASSRKGLFAAALDTQGNVWAWGDNTDGELGNGTTGGSDAQPVKVRGLSGVTQISPLGDDGVAAVLPNGQVDYWGKVTGTAQASPQPVPGLSGIAAITNGLALGGNGTVTVLDPGQAHPPAVAGLPAPVTSVAGNGHTFLAIAGPSATVYAWGQNQFGQVGNGTMTSQATPVALPLTHAAQIAVASFGSSAAVLSNGTAWQWGSDRYPGAGASLRLQGYLVPAQVPGVSGVSQLAFSAFGVLAVGQLAAPGTVQAWGTGNGGQLGNGTTAASAATPVTVQGAAVIPRLISASKATSDEGLAAVSTGANHSLAVGADGSVLAWGTNTFGQLGDGLKASTAAPVTVHLPAKPDGTARNAVQVAAGGQFSLALADDGTVWSWGGNGNGQLGNGNNTTQLSPVQVSIPAGPVAQIGAGTAFGLALAADGTVWGWGANDKGQLGNGTTQRSSNPQKITMPWDSTSGRALSVTAGSNFALATDGLGVAAWGADDKAQLGNGTTEPMATTAATVYEPSTTEPDVADVAAGGSAGYAIRSNGTLVAWGDDSSGQLGDGAQLGGSTPPPLRTSPVTVSLPDGAQVLQVGAGATAAVAYTATGTALSWGTGALGAGGSVTSSSTPVAVSLPGELVVGVGAGPASGTALAVVEPLTPPGP